MVPPDADCVVTPLSRHAVGRKLHGFFRYNRSALIVSSSRIPTATWPFFSSRHAHRAILYSSSVNDLRSSGKLSRRKLCSRDNHKALPSSIDFFTKAMASISASASLAKSSVQFSSVTRSRAPCGMCTTAVNVHRLLSVMGFTKTSKE